MSAPSSPPSSKLEAASPVEQLASDSHYAATLGKYRVLGALGRGGMAEVYLAIADGPEGFRKLCVLKLLREDLHDDVDFRTMFLDEARLAARLTHPHIVQTFEVDESEGRLLIAMEFVDGQPLTRVLRHVSLERFPLEASVRVLCDVLDALEYAHELTDFDGSKLGIVHRDVTPHNVLIGYDARVKLVDFGIAKSTAAAAATQAGVVKGKVGYMAPEQASLADNVDGRADIFSVGVMLWELIAQRRLTSGLSGGREVLMRRMAGEDPRIETVAADVDPKLAEICNKAMAPEPEQRYAHAAEMQADLERWLQAREEPPRREIAATLREVFAADRAQLRVLVEERMANAGISGLPRGFSPAMTGSIQAMSLGAAQSLTRSSIPPAHESVPPGGHESASIPPARDMSVPPPSGARTWLWPAVALLSLAVMSGTIVYITQMRELTSGSPPAPPVAQEPAPTPTQERVAPAASDAVEPPPAERADVTQSAPEKSPTSKPAHGRPGPSSKPVSEKPATNEKPVASEKPAKPTASASPGKPGARPIDEQDPYN